MRKTELVKLVSEQCGLSRYQADDAVSSLFEQITNALSRGERVNLLGFGSFSVKSRAAHSGKNPQTHETIHIPAKNHIQFKPGKRLSDALIKD
ncbi:DNA-binding protein HU-beta [Alteromonadaceae bacterium 2753L.S.0a.02]|nr:DNA-binding protein HU-beta [Alteromonadaceae bacterium 2753L.S.0a.02]